MKQILKGAVVLLIAITMVFSTVAIADTQTKETTIELNTTHQGSGYGALGPVVWDNGMEYDGLAAAQDDQAYPFSCYEADDFHFDVDTEVMDVHWVGGYWAGDPAEFDWCISFYKDDGSGESPAGMPYEPTFAGPYCYAWDEITKEELEPGYYSMSVDLPETLTFIGCEKYWISIWGVGVYPPQSGWGMHQDPVTLTGAVWGSDFFGFPFWTPGFDVQGYDHDMCFQLTGPQVCEPGVDLEKQVWDEKNGRWVDADTENTAFDVVICTDIQFKITIINTGNCPLFQLEILDKMHNSLKYLGADPEPDEYYFEDPFHIMKWHIPQLLPGQEIVIYVNAHVEGPECSIDVNHAEVQCQCEHGTVVFDEDDCFIHAKEKAREFNSPILNFLENHPNMFPLLQLVLQRLGLF
jgi:hypothetical protein